MKFYKRPGFWFFVSAVAFLIAGLVSLLIGNPAIDLAMHDMYFVIAKGHIYLLLSLILIVFTLIYFLFDYLKVPLKKNLGLLHFLGTVIPFALIFAATGAIMNQGTPRRYYSLDAYKQFDMFSNLNKLITLSVLFFAMAQLLLIVNILIALVRNKTR